MTQRLWFITGAGRGLGRAFTEVALEHGDRVVATIRRDGVLDDLAKEYGDRLIPRRLDIAVRDDVFRVVDEVAATVGTPDVVVNNAGYGLVGAVEELSEEELRAQFDVNLFGAVWVTQAVLPHLRARGSGRIVQVSSVGAVGHLPLFGAYNATKWALEGLSAGLAEEVKPLGIDVHLLQLGGFATDWAGSSMRFTTADPAYDETRTAILGMPSYPTPEMIQAATDEAAAEVQAGTGDLSPAGDLAAAVEGGAGGVAAESAAAEEGAAEGPAGEGVAAEGAAGEGAAAEGAAGDEAAMGSAAGERVAAEGAAGDEAAMGSAAGEGAAGEGVAAEGAAGEGAGDGMPEDESPRVAAEALLTLLDEPEPPLREVIGAGAHEMVRMALGWRRDDYERDPAFVWPDASQPVG
ncbi:SDR family NAD(P)-dependent oxidoreductase [Kribbella qitaiheensis]|uniref:SDR family NAD(P)-dependent oxidoreductase n=1 Tax=Kribbella qitaiheensis TaxID=1544730 RepID=UPI003616D73B